MEENIRNMNEHQIEEKPSAHQEIQPEEQHAPN